jgi:hypothetical protein
MITNRLGNLVVCSTHFHHFGDECSLPAVNYSLESGYGALPIAVYTRIPSQSISGTARVRFIYNS